MANHNLKKISLCATALTGVALMLSSCVSSTGGKPLAQMTFNHIAPKPIYVASYEAVAIPSGASSLPEGFVADPAKVVHDYLNNRFEAAGNRGKLRVSVQYASVEHDVVASRNKFGKVLGIDKSDHYVMKVGIALQAFGFPDFDTKSTMLNATRDVYISEHVSLVERERLQLEALDKMVDDLDIPIRKVFTEEFGIMH